MLACLRGNLILTRVGSVVCPGKPDNFRIRTGHNPKRCVVMAQATFRQRPPTHEYGRPLLTAGAARITWPPRRNEETLAGISLPPCQQTETQALPWRPQQR